MKGWAYLGMLGLCLTVSSPGAAKTRITMYSPYGAGPYQEAWEQLSRNYMKAHPDVNIVVLPGDWGIVDKLIAQAAAGTGPDLAVITESYVGKLGYLGLLENLDPMMTRSKFPLGDYYKAPMDAYRTRYKGTRGQYGLPLLYSGYGFLYNKTMFAKRGLAHPSKDWTMDDSKEYITKLTVDANNDGKFDQWGIDMQNHQNRMVGYIRSFGGDVMDEEKDELLLDNNRSIQGLQFFDDLWARYKAVMQDGFSRGVSAMYMTSAFAVPGMRKSKFEWDACAFPVGPKGQRSVAMPTAGLAMLKLCKNKDTAWDILKYFMSKEAQEYLGKAQISVPVHEAGSGSWLRMDDNPKNGEIFVDSVKYARPSGTAPYMDDVFRVLVNKNGDALTGKTDAAGVVKSIIPELAAVLKKYKARMSR